MTCQFQISITGDSSKKNQNYLTPGTYITPNFFFFSYIIFFNRLSLPLAPYCFRVSGNSWNFCFPLDLTQTNTKKKIYRTEEERIFILLVLVLSFSQKLSRENLTKRMDSSPVNWEALDALIIDFAKSEKLIEDSSPPSPPSLTSSSLSSSSYHSRLIIRQIRRSLEAGDIDVAIDLIRAHAPFVLDDHRLLFRIQKQVNFLILSIFYQ